jgi:hypothetical protein
MLTTKKYVTVLCKHIIIIIIIITTTTTTTTTTTHMASSTYRDTHRTKIHYSVFSAHRKKAITNHIRLNIT